MRARLACSVPNVIVSACVIVTVALAIIFSIKPSAAEIFRHVDESGVIHFTDAPTGLKSEKSITLKPLADPQESENNPKVDNPINMKSNPVNSPEDFQNFKTKP